MTGEILLGWEVGTGKRVDLPLHHTVIAGMTQKAGKTTSLEAIISRSGLKAVAFKTKRGESGFSNYNTILPYYKTRTDWMYLESLLNAALGEKVKYEPGMRNAVMDVAGEEKKRHETDKIIIPQSCRYYIPNAVMM